MPIYEYRRPDGTTFEIQQSFSEEALTADPDTGVPVERVLHAPAVHFKGKGFYHTDYGTRKGQREAAAAGEESKGPQKESSSSDGSGSSSDGSGSSSDGSGDGRASASPAPARGKGSAESGAAKESKPAQAEG